MDKNLIQRLVSGFFYGLIIFFCTHPLGSFYLGKIIPGITQLHLYFALMTFLMAVGLWECVRLIKFNPKSWEKYVVFPIAALVYYRFAMKFFGGSIYFNFGNNLSEILGILLILIAVVTLFRFPKELEYDSGKLLFSVIYVVLPFGFSLGLPQYLVRSGWPHLYLETFMLFILIWSSDSFAYFAGRLFGKHKMAPAISPKKTWEGFAGGVILTLILGFFIEKYLPELRGNWMIVGFLVSVFAPLGDLVESQLKRTFGVKDSGNIIPGHGGVLDRLDSFIICAPVVYLYFILDTLF